MTEAVAVHGILDVLPAGSEDRVAVELPDGPRMTYRELVHISDALRDRLRHLGVGVGDRVGICLPKTPDAVAAIFGILKTGAAYVPVDCTAPVERCAYILRDCGVRALICDHELAHALSAELERQGASPQVLAIEASECGKGLADVLRAAQLEDAAPVAETVFPGPDALAYVLYTSGSTGRPKGVMLSHRNALSFIRWCWSEFEPVESDRFASHAPFHFDLSILDIFLSLSSGATLVLIGESVGKDPHRLAALIAECRLSVWYSTPSILGLLAQHGKLERHDYGHLRLVLFAGEVFPVAQLRQLRSFWPAARFVNLYGPTETNVCTFYEIPTYIPLDRQEPYPIGRACAQFEMKVVGPTGARVGRDEEGELVVRGEGVMRGYWNMPEQSERCFLIDESGGRWYRTGDLVVQQPDGDYVFHGRRDRMVKRRGFRVELGEIEAALSNHPRIQEVAVVAYPEDESSVRIKAFLSSRQGGRLSPIELKQFCMRHLPSYMIPDYFGMVDALPRTSTDKVDYQELLLTI